MAVFRKSVFIASATQVSQRKLSPLPEIALCGRSNVGKSSLINALCGQNALARVSKTPGCTRLINTFCIEDSFYLVDLPGYGYAAASGKQQQDWSKFLPEYLQGSTLLKMVLLLVDFRHPPTVLDKQMMAWLMAQGMTVRVVATKADLVPKSRRHRHLMDLVFELKLNMNSDVIPVSARLGEGLETLATVVRQAVK